MNCPECLTEEGTTIEMTEVDSEFTLVSTGNYENEPEYRTEWVKYSCPVCGYEETIFNN